MKTNIELSVLILSLLLFFTSNGAALALPDWVECSYRAEAALKGGNFEAAQDFLGKALPQADKVASESPDRKGDLQNLCAVYDNWKQLSVQVAKEKSELKTEQDVQQTSAKVPFNKKMTEMRKHIDQKIKDGQNYVQMLETAIDLRKKVYGPQDKTAIIYQSDLRTQKWALDALKNLRSLTDAKTPDEMSKMMTTPTAVNIFTSAFSTPMDKISELTGGGYEKQDDHVWIRFKSSLPVALQSCKVPFKDSPNLKRLAGQFLNVCPQDSKWLAQTTVLEGSQGTDSLGRGDWALLSNKKQGIYWFRHSGGE